MLAIDHIVLPVLDLADAAAAFETRYGLSSVEGGRHPAWGTANRIVPLGDAYVELVAVVDPEAAAQAMFGTWVASARPGRPLGWAVRTDSIDAIARRLGLAIVPGSRAAPGGRIVTWRSAGLENAKSEPGLPFFIQWGPGVPLPGATPTRHRDSPARLKLLTVTGDPARLAEWLGEQQLPLSVTAGPPRLAAVVVSLGHRDVELRDLAVVVDRLPGASDIQ